MALPGHRSEKAKATLLALAQFNSYQVVTSMLVARAHGYDANPVGDYDKKRIAEAFGKDKGHYVPFMLVSIGKADDDGYSSMRLPVDRVAEWK